MAAVISSVPTVATMPGRKVARCDADVVSDESSSLPEGRRAAEPSRREDRRGAREGATRRLIALAWAQEIGRAFERQGTNGEPVERVAIFFAIECAHAEREGERCGEEERHREPIERATHRAESTSGG